MERFATRHRQVLLLGSVIGILTLSALALLTLSVFNNTPAQTNGIRTAEEYWKSRIRSEGPANAYSEMIESTATSTAEAQHLAAHAFGGALFQEDGLAGFSVCTDAYASGCYHEFMGEAIVSKGLSSVAELSASCQSLGANAWACIHGIGHGLLGYFGYSLGDLRQALTACSSYMDGPDSKQCSKGAFMEYDLRRILNASDDAPVRTFSKAERFTPCTDVDASEQVSCYWGRAWWWYQTADPLRAKTPAFFAEMGSYCGELTDAPQRSECFKGVGFAASFAGAMDPAGTAQLCEAAAAPGALRQFCKMGAAINIVHERHPAPADICAALGLSGSALDQCIRAGSSTPADSQ